MALDALLAKLDADAERERAAVLSRAEETAAALRREAEEEREEVLRRTVARARTEEEASARRRLGEARSEARHRVADARGSFLSRVRAAVEERIADAATDPVYLGGLEREVRAVARRAPEGRLTFRAPPELVVHLREVAQDTLPARDVTVAEDGDVGPGFLATLDGERVVLDSTLSARLERAWRREAMRVLEEASP